MEDICYERVSTARIEERDQSERVIPEVGHLVRESEEVVVVKHHCMSVILSAQVLLSPQTKENVSNRRSRPGGSSRPCKLATHTVSLDHDLSINTHRERRNF